MHGTITKGGATTTATEDDVRSALGSGTFFWLDLDSVGTAFSIRSANAQAAPASVTAATPATAPVATAPPPLIAPVPADGSATDVLMNLFHFHPLTVEDAENFGQRPKLDEYDDYTYMVVHGAPITGTTTTEIHLFFSEQFVVTVHNGPCHYLDDVRQRVDHHHSSEAAAPQIVLMYLIVDTLTDSFFPVLSAFDDQIDTLESAILKQPTEEQLGQLFNMKRSLMSIRKVVTPQRDMFAALSAGVSEIPGMTDESSRYFRDLYDHLIRISDMVDSYRDLLSGVMDTHLSTVSNRLNVVMKQLAIIATIFLPLSFLTGFFGQNFAWLVTHITGGFIFLWLGIGSEVLAVIFLVALFKRRGWLGGPSA